MDGTGVVLTDGDYEDGLRARLVSGERWRGRHALEVWRTFLTCFHLRVRSSSYRTSDERVHGFTLEPNSYVIF